MREFPFTMDYVLRDLCQPNFKRERANGKGELVVCCPLQPEKDFEVNVREGIWRCFKGCPSCPVQGKGGVLDLYQLFFKCEGRRDAYNRIMETLEPNKAIVERRRKEKLEPRVAVSVANPDELHKTYSTLLQELTLSKEHRRKLLERGIAAEDIEAIGFRSIPQSGMDVIAKKLQMAGCLIKGVPGFFLKDEEPQISCRGSGFFIPYRNQENRIVGLQIRYDITLSPEMSEKEKKDAKQRRYRWFTSSSEEGGASAANVPFYGLSHKERKKGVAYATEGGLKAATAASLSGGWFVAIPGVTCYTAWETLLEYLKSQNVNTLVDAFDSDRATNESVAAAIQKLHGIAQKHGFEMQTWNWGTEYKGVDDYLLAKKQGAVCRSPSGMKPDQKSLHRSIENGYRATAGVNRSAT